jgi:hypothetical protein
MAIVSPSPFRSTPAPSQAKPARRANDELVDRKPRRRRAARTHSEGALMARRGAIGAQVCTRVCGQLTRAAAARKIERGCASEDTGGERACACGRFGQTQTGRLQPALIGAPGRRGRRETLRYGRRIVGRCAKRGEVERTARENLPRAAGDEAPGRRLGLKKRRDAVAPVVGNCVPTAGANPEIAGHGPGEQGADPGLKRRPDAAHQRGTFVRVGTSREAQSGAHHGRKARGDQIPVGLRERIERQAA